MKRRATQIAAVALCSLAAVTLVLWQVKNSANSNSGPSWWNQELKARRMQGAARRIAECVANQDAACVSGYVSKEEVAAFGLDQEGLESLVALAIERVGKAKLKSLTTSDEAPGLYGTAIYNASFTSDGPIKAVPIWIDDNDGSPVSRDLLSALLRQRWRQDPRPVSATTRSGRIVMKVLRGFSEDRPLLERQGATGIFYKGRRWGLDEYKEYLEVALVDLEGPKDGGPP